MAFAIGEHVWYRHFYPGNIWDAHIWWICGKTTDEASWRPPVTMYRLARLDDPDAYGQVHTCVHEDMLRTAERTRSEG